jgi:hypothetical protein
MHFNKTAIKNCVLHTLQFGLNILYLLGVCVLLHGLQLGISGGYIALFAAMVISGAIVAGILVNTAIHRRQEDDVSRLYSACMETALLSAMGFVYDRSFGIMVLILSLVLILFTKFAKGKKIYSLGNALFGIVWVAEAMMIVFCLAKSSITSARAMLMIFCCSELLWEIREIGYHSPDQEEVKLTKTVGELLKPDKKDIIPVILQTMVFSGVMTAFGMTVPLLIKAFNETSAFNGNRYFAYLACCVIGVCVFQFILTRINSTSLHDCIFRGAVSAVLCAAAASLYLMSISLMIGVVCMFSILASIAIGVAMENSGHMSSDALYNVRYTAGQIFSILILITAFTQYDSIIVDTSVVMMVWFLFFGVHMCTRVFEHYDVYLSAAAKNRKEEEETE